MPRTTLLSRNGASLGLSPIRLEDLRYPFRVTDFCWTSFPATGPYR